MKKQLILPSKRLRSEILMKIEDIASFLAAISDKKGNETIKPGLFSGYAGVALFLFYYSRFKKDTCIADVAMNYLENTVTSIERVHYGIIFVVELAVYAGVYSI